MPRFWRGITRPSVSRRALNSIMTIESIIRRRAFRDGFYDGRQGCSMRRLATRKARWLYALGRIFANVAPTNLQVYEQRHATEAAVAAFRAMPVRYMAR
jgi:transposase